MQKDLKLIENPQLFYGCLHFRYNKKKYLYGISEQLLTFGEENGLLSKMNGFYQPSQRQKKEKSTLQLKKQKLIMKIDYIILPRKACQNQYLWHFENLFQNLGCRQFLILTQNQHKSRFQNATEDFLLKRKLISLLKKENQQNSIQNTSATTFKVQMFRQHQNAFKKGIDQKTFQKPKQQNMPGIQNVFMEQVDEIFQEDINHLILETCKKETFQYAQKSIFHHINSQFLLSNISVLLNEIHHNSNHQKQLQLTPQQIQLKKKDLSQQILRISQSENVIYPTQNQQGIIVFLPLTSMIGIQHKHNVTLINPSNLASWRWHHLHFPVSNVKQIILTRFSISFVEFIIAWSSIGVQQKVHSFLQIVTLDWIYKKIKQKLYELFLWDDQIILSKIAFRVIPSNKKNPCEQNSRQIQEKQPFYTAGYLKICHQKDSIGQQSWILKFGDKQFLYLNEILIWKQDWLKRFNFIIFDKIKQDIKNSLYEKSKSNDQIRKKCVYNRSSSSKYRNKYLYCLNESNPVIRMNSLIKIQQTFIPYILNLIQKERYHKVRLSPGQSINCLDRNILLIQGLVAVTNEYFITQNVQNKSKVQKQTYVWLCWPVDFTMNGMFSSLSLNKIRKVKQLIALKQSLILVEQLEDQHFLDNHQIGSNDHPQAKQDKKNLVNHASFSTQSNNQTSGNKMQNCRLLLSSPLIAFDKLQISDMSSNSLIKLLSRHSTNFHLSYKSLNQANNNLPSSLVESFSPLYQFSQLFKKVTLQSGQFINQNNQKVYFVIKGSLKWKSYQQKELTANNQSFIGNLKYFFQHKILSNIGNQQINTFTKDIENQQEQIVPIEVIKDTWALEADIKELHSKFLVRFPQIAYWMVSKGKIFY